MLLLAGNNDVRGGFFAIRGLALTGEDLLFTAKKYCFPLACLLKGLPSVKSSIH